MFKRTSGRRSRGWVLACAGLLVFSGTLTPAISTAAGNAKEVKPQALPPNSPEYLRFSYPAALAAPLPQRSPTAARAPIQMLQSYPNPAGQVGIFQGAGAVVPANNAFFQSLGSNGRSCFSCHRPSDGMSLSTATLNKLFDSTAGTDPVFAPVDGANCPSAVARVQTVAAAVAGSANTQDLGALRDAYSVLLNRGLFRIFLPMPKNAEFSLSVYSDPYGCNTDPKYATQIDPSTGERRQMISVYRRPRMSANLTAATTPSMTTMGGGSLPHIDFITGLPVLDANGHAISGNIMWDGREATLESQAISATLGHAQAVRAPTAAQVAEMVSFERGVMAAQIYDQAAGFLNARSGTLVSGGPEAMFNQPASSGPFSIYDAWPTQPGSSPPGTQAARASIARGQALFNTRQFTVNDTAGFNNARLLGTTNPTTATCASCHGNLPTGADGFPAGQRDIGIGGQAMFFSGAIPANDLPMFRLTCLVRTGQAYNNPEVITNDPGLALITGRCADIGRRTVPQLRALAARAPYFSDGSAATLEAVLAYYRQRYGLALSARDITDLTNFMRAL